MDYERLALSQQDEAIADLVNDLMEIPVGWLDYAEPVDQAHIFEFQTKLFDFLNAIEKRSELIDAAVVISALMRNMGDPDYPQLPLPSLERYYQLDKFNALKRASSDRLGGSFRGNPEEERLID